MWSSALPTISFSQRACAVLPDARDGRREGHDSRASDCANAAAARARHLPTNRICRVHLDARHEARNTKKSLLRRRIADRRPVNSCQSRTKTTSWRKQQFRQPRELLRFHNHHRHLRRVLIYSLSCSAFIHHRPPRSSPSPSEISERQRCDRGTLVQRSAERIGERSRRIRRDRHRDQVMHDGCAGRKNCGNRRQVSSVSRANETADRMDVRGRWCVNGDGLLWAPVPATSRSRNEAALSVASTQGVVFPRRPSVRLSTFGRTTSSRRRCAIRSSALTRR